MKNIDKHIYGDIILADCKFTDHTSSKIRPLLVLRNDQADYITLKMSTQNHDEWDNFLISTNNTNNVKKDTYIYYKKVISIDSILLIKKLWNISDLQKDEIKQKLSTIICDL